MKTLAFRSLLPFAFACCATLLHAQTVTFKPVVKFAYPGAFSTLPEGINDAGTVVGAFIVTPNDYGKGFERSADGTLSPSIIYPGSTVFQTIPTAIDNNGTIAGWYNTQPGFTHGFFLTQGVFTSFDYPGANYTTITGINDAGDFVGNYALADTVQHSYASIGGQLREITIPGATYVEAHDINNHGDIVGWYNTPQTSLGFRLKSDGTLFYPLKAPGYPATVLFGTDDGRSSVGQAPNFEASEAVYFLGNHAAFTYIFPHLTYNQFTGLNARGLICGYGFDALNSINYGYLVRPMITSQAR